MPTLTGRKRAMPFCTTNTPSCSFGFFFSVVSDGLAAIGVAAFVSLAGFGAARAVSAMIGMLRARSCARW